MIETITNYVALAMLILSSALAIINFLMVRINRKKKKQDVVLSEETLQEDKSDSSIAEDVLKLVKEIIPSVIEEVEHSGVLGSDAKKCVALSKIMLKCSELGIDYNANVKTISETIEDLIKFSKQVNSSLKV